MLNSSFSYFGMALFPFIYKESFPECNSLFFLFYGNYNHPILPELYHAAEKSIAGLVNILLYMPCIFFSFHLKNLLFTLDFWQFCSNQLPGDLLS